MKKFECITADLSGLGTKKCFEPIEPKTIIVARTGKELVISRLISLNMHDKFDVLTEAQAIERGIDVAELKKAVSGQTLAFERLNEISKELIKSANEFKISSKIPEFQSSKFINKPKNNFNRR